MPKHTREEALFMHKRLPRRIWRILREAGLPDELIHRRLIGWDGRRITVPVFGKDRRLSHLAYLSDPLESGGLGAIRENAFRPAALYGWETIQARPKRLYVAIDVWERLLLEGRDFRAVGISGEPMTFKESWVEDFQGIRQVFVAFPRTGLAQRAARRIVELIPQARLLYLPPMVGEGGVADFFLALKQTRSDFLRLLPPEEPREDNGEEQAA